MSESVISVGGLCKSYGDFDAVCGIDLEVRRGEVFGFLGPNGAGKTTTTEILEGYRERDAGEVRVLGADPASAGRVWRGRIGIVLQKGRMRPTLTVRETVELFAGYYDTPRPVTDTIALVGLTEKADDRVGRLSGGQARRLDVALGLIGDPELVFLDEPTTGFDPSARRQAWEMIEGLRGLGKTIFLTTHYMEEAQRLADRVAIVVAGRIVAEGRPDELGGRDEQPARISFRLEGARPEAVDGLAIDFDESGDAELVSADPVRDLHKLTAWSLERGVALRELEVRRPSLEDVYLELTGQSVDRAREEEGP